MDCIEPRTSAIVMAIGYIAIRLFISGLHWLLKDLLSKFGWRGAAIAGVAILASGPFWFVLILGYLAYRAYEAIAKSKPRRIRRPAKSPSKVLVFPAKSINRW